MYSPAVQTVQNSQFYLPALSLLAGSGSEIIIPDPDSGKNFGSMQIRIRNIGLNGNLLSHPSPQKITYLTGTSQPAHSWIRLQYFANSDPDSN